MLFTTACKTVLKRINAIRSLGSRRLAVALVTVGLVIIKTVLDFRAIAGANGGVGQSLFIFILGCIFCVVIAYTVYISFRTQDKKSDRHESNSYVRSKSKLLF